MRIFALETDSLKLERRLLSEDEIVLRRVRFSVFLFLFRLIRAVFFTAILVAVGFLFSLVGFPASWVSLILFVVWFFVVFIPLVNAFIDWKFDFILVTTEEVVVVDQTSIIRLKIQQIGLDSIIRVTAVTQFLHIFPFGRLHFDLQEGAGNVDLPYIPHAETVAASVSNAIVLNRRRESLEAKAIEQGMSPEEAKRSALRQLKLLP
jgi:hypothetical protein